MNDKQIALLQAALQRRYPGGFERTVKIRDFVETICRRHIELGLGDPDILKKLCSDSAPTYHQQISEILFAHELLESGHLLIPSHDGPDLLLEQNGRKVWIEVICPEPKDVPAAWLSRAIGTVRSMPHEAMLLRWTAAIKEKAEKLLGDRAGLRPGYLKKGIVGPDDSYVIAVNGRMLRTVGSQLEGISQFPFAAEAVFAFGAYQIHLDRKTLEVVDADHQHRPVIKKPNGAQVPANTFLDPHYNAISAIWAADMDESSIIGNAKPMAVVHNPNGSNPIPLEHLPAHAEYVARESNDKFYTLTKLPGRLAD